MRANWITILCGIAVSLHVASPQSACAWSQGGIPVSANAATEVAPSVAADGAGGVFICWVRSAVDSGGIFVLDLDADGGARPGWSDAGLRVLAGGTDPYMVEDGAGGAFVVARSGGAIYLAHVPSVAGGINANLTSREPMFGRFSAKPLPQLLHNGFILPIVIPDGPGRAFVSFINNGRFYNAGFVRHYEADQSLAQFDLSSTGCGNFICDINAPALCSDGAGGVFVAWGQSCGVRLLRLTPEMTVSPGWPAAGVVVDSCVTQYAFTGMCGDQMGGAYVAWQGYPTTTGRHDFRLQRLTGAGTVSPGWPDTGAVISPYETLPGFGRQGFGAACSIVPDGSGGALMAWTDLRADSGDVYVQRVLPDGSAAPGWPVGGIGAGTAQGIQEAPVLCADGLGGAFVTWQGQRLQRNDIVEARHITGVGGLLPANAPAIPGEGAGLRGTPRIAALGQSDAVIAWVDYRSGNADIYANRLGPDGAVGVLVSLVRAEAREDEVQIEWSVAGRIDQIGIERREATTEFTEVGRAFPDGMGRVRYVDASVEPGHRYAYRLRFAVDGTTEYSQATWITLPLKAAPSLQMIGANPHAGPIRARVMLKDARPAVLQLVDTQGRIWSRLIVSTSDGGPHDYELRPEHPLALGIYFLALKQGNASSVIRTCILE